MLRAAQTAQIPRSIETDNTESIALAAQAGFSFRQYDLNQDGKVSRDELTIIRVESAKAGTGFGGAVRINSVPCLTVGEGLCVESPAATLGENTHFLTAAHELAHLIGAIDVCGPWNSPYITNNLNHSLMAATVDEEENSDFSIHVDAWQMMRWGWVNPTVHDLGVPQCFEMAPAAAPEGAVLPEGATREPILVYDHQRGLSDYFLTEYRSAAPVDAEWSAH
jgi:M6 family metalloprotease-like protein